MLTRAGSTCRGGENYPHAPYTQLLLTVWPTQKLPPAPISTPLQSARSLNHFSNSLRPISTSSAAQTLPRSIRKQPLACGAYFLSARFDDDPPIAKTRYRANCSGSFPATCKNASVSFPGGAPHTLVSFFRGRSSESAG